MADRFDRKTRSRMMSAIRSKNSRPELLVRSLLHRLGYRFRLHRADLPGTPDIVLPRYRSVVLVNGCFWHRHSGCRYAYQPKSRVEFWEKKFADNVKRDRKVRRELGKRGWRVIVVWECELRKMEHLAVRLERELQG